MLEMCQYREAGSQGRENTQTKGIKWPRGAKPQGVTLFLRSEYFPDPNSLAHGIGIAVKYVVVRKYKKSCQIAAIEHHLGNNIDI